MTANHLALGIDIGGTFTDIVLYNPDDGGVCSHKELTTPHEPTEGAIRGIKILLEREGIPFQQVVVPQRRAERDEVEALTYQRRVPVLVIDGEAICDSRRIVEHLEFRRSG